jgi:hypothetical protein
VTRVYRGECSEELALGGIASVRLGDEGNRVEKPELELGKISKFLLRCEEFDALLAEHDVAAPPKKHELGLPHPTREGLEC